MAYIDDTTLAATGPGQGANMVGFRQSGAAAVARTAMAKLNEIASVKDFGAVGDGITDDSAAFQAAVNASQYLYVPPGRYKFGSTVSLANAQVVFGAGKSGWEPYHASVVGHPFPDTVKSEILVDGIKAFDASGRNSAAIRGLSIKAIAGTQSVYGLPAGYQAGAIGIDITASSQFEADDVSFFGLETAILATQGATAQMPKITNWSASDCDRVFRFGSALTSEYIVRDSYIGNCTVALHNNGIVEAHHCDGLRIESCRFFPGYGSAIYVRKTPFLSIIGVTVFETGSDAVVLEESNYVTMAGFNIVRPGRYKTAQPWPQRKALVLTNCTDVAFQGLISEPSGMPVRIAGCSNITINAAFQVPFSGTGNEQNSDGAVTITNSSYVNLNGSFSERFYHVAVWADAESSSTLTGSISSHPAVGTVRALKLQQHGAFVHKLDQAAGPIAAGGTSAPICTMRVFVPAGKILTTRSVEMTSSDVRLRVGTAFWNAATTTEPGGGSVDVSVGKFLYDNRVGSDGWFEVPLTLFNSGSSPVTVPAGHETRISTVLV